MKKKPGRVGVEAQPPSAIVKSVFPQSVRDELNAKIAERRKMGREYTPFQLEFISAKAIFWYCHTVQLFLDNLEVAPEVFVKVVTPSWLELTKQNLLATLKKGIRTHFFDTVDETIDRESETKLERDIKFVQQTTYPAFAVLSIFLQESRAGITEEEAVKILNAKLVATENSVTVFASGGVTSAVTQAAQKSIRAKGSTFTFNQRGIETAIKEDDEGIEVYTQENLHIRTPYKMEFSDKSVLPTCEKFLEVFLYFRERLARHISLKGGYGLTEPVRMSVDDLVGEDKPFKRKGDAKEAFLAVRKLLEDLRYNQLYQQTDRNGNVVNKTIDGREQIIEVITPFVLGYYTDRGEKTTSKRAFWGEYSVRLSKDVRNPNVLINKLVAVPLKANHLLSPNNKALVLHLLDLWTRGKRTKPVAIVDSDMLLDFIGCSAETVKRHPQRAIDEAKTVIAEIKAGLDNDLFPVFELCVDETLKLAGKRLKSMHLKFAVAFNPKRLVF